MPPYLRQEPPWFVFLLHPRDLADIDTWGGAPLLRSLTQSDQEFETKALSTPPIVVGEVLFRSGSGRGEIVGVPEIGMRMLGARGRGLVVDAARLAVQRGARVLGLGALTSPATRGGRSLVPHVGTEITITTGNAYTAAVARHNVLEAIDLLGEPAPRVAVVGATGSVGAALARMLADDGLDLVLVGRTAERVGRALPDLAGRVRFEGDLAAAAAADVVVLLTSDPSVRLAPALFAGRSSESIVIDVAQPPNVAAGDVAALRAAGAYVVPGGVVTIPGVSVTQETGLPPESAFACLAETYLFAREGLRDHSVGPASTELARRMERVAARHGVEPRPLGLARLEPVLAEAPA